MGQYADIASNLLYKYLDMPKELGHQIYLETSGIPFKEQLEIISPSVDYEIISKDFEDRKLEIRNKCLPFPEVKPTLDLLTGRMHKIALVSSNQYSFVLHCIVRWGISYYFNWISGIGPYKNKEDQIRDAMEVIGYSDNLVLYCGDSAHDKELAESLNIQFYPVHPQFNIKDIPMREPIGA